MIIFIIDMQNFTSSKRCCSRCSNHKKVILVSTIDKTSIILLSKYVITPLTPSRFGSGHRPSSIFKR